MTTIPDSSALIGWRKSSYSNGEGAECVEVADGVTGLLPVRDSKNPYGPALVFGLGAWTAFVDEVKCGDDS